MDQALGPDGVARLEAYFDRIGTVLNDDRRRASFATYALGLMGEGDRKSVEPIAARASGDPIATQRAHDRLLHFAVDSKWSDRNVRHEAASYGLAAMTTRGPIETWIVDDTGFLKQGSHSVGVQRQYTGSAGKVTNCQIGASLTVATRTEHLPIDFELYLPHSWTDSPARRAEARIPDEVTFKTKPELALQMIRRAREDKVPLGVVLGDTAFGTSSDFRLALRRMGMDYALAVTKTTKVWRMDRLGRRRGAPLPIEELARSPQFKYRRCTWREGTRKSLSSRFALERIVPFHDDGVPPSVREDVLVLMEWEDHESVPTKFYFVRIDPGRQLSTKQLVRILKQRWRTERVYEDLKGELGFDHYEGRRFPGWHHHVSVALACFAFIVAERGRRFPPSTGAQAQAHAFQLAA